MSMHVAIDVKFYGQFTVKLLPPNTRRPLYSDSVASDPERAFGVRDRDLRRPCFAR
jgi:hypothetical protein